VITDYLAVLDDLAERVGRIATESMLVWSPSERSSVEIAGYLAAGMTLDAICEHFAAADAADFVDGLRSVVARWEEQGA
jgi:hypothetical protein